MRRSLAACRFSAIYVAPAAAGAVYLVDASRKVQLENATQCDTSDSNVRRRDINIWFVRHGESENNVLKRKMKKSPDYSEDVYERARFPDPGLSDVGLEQARRLPHFEGPLTKLLSSGRPVDIYCSPLKRAIETAAPLQKMLRDSPPLRLRADICEKGGMREYDETGVMVDIPGMTPDEIRACYPLLTLITDELPSAGWWSGMGVEDMSEMGNRNFQARVLRVAQWIKTLEASTETGHDVIIVGHGALFSHLLPHLLGCPWLEVAVELGNTSVSRLHLQRQKENVKVIVRCVNSVPAGLKN